VLGGEGEQQREVALAAAHVEQPQRARGLAAQRRLERAL
jgi:hypothetical protein